MEIRNKKLCFQATEEQIYVLLETMVKRGHQVCCDLNWHNSLHTMDGYSFEWHFIYDPELDRFLECYRDSKTDWLLVESKDYLDIFWLTRTKLRETNRGKLQQRHD